MSTKQAIIEDRFSCPQCFAVFRSGFARCPLCGDPLQPFDVDPLVGVTLLDKYDIQGCIGEGGMGRVYRARHTLLNSDVAIKVLFGDHAADPKMKTRLVREAMSAAKLDHRNVIRVRDAGTTRDGLLYLIMDYVDGIDLATLIGQEAPFGRERVINLTRQLCMGLGHAHDKGLVHRDFKSENVIITRDADGELAKIVDFGIAVMHEPSQDAHTLTSEGMVLGTPAFMAPEQSTGGKVDHRADLFSLGVLLYEMLAGKLPFDGTPLEIARQNLGAQPPRIEDRVEGLVVEPGLEDIAFGLMAKRAEERFQSAHHVLRALERVAVGSGATPSGQYARPDTGSTELPLLVKPRGKGEERRGSSELPTLRSTLTNPVTPEDQVPEYQPFSTIETAQVSRGAGPGGTDPFSEETELAFEVRGGVRAWMVVLFLLFAVAGAAGGYIYVQGDGAAGAVEKPDAGPGASVPVPAVATDAAPAPTVADSAVPQVEETEPADAAPADDSPAPQVDTKDVRRNRKNRRQGKDKEKETSEPEETVTAPVTDEVSPDQLEQLWQSTGRAVEKLYSEKGQAVTRPYTKRYMRIHLATAMTNGELRRKYYRQLKALRSEIYTELKK